MDNESKADEERRHRLEVESLVAQLRAIDDIMSPQDFYLTKAMPLSQRNLAET